MRQIDKLAVVIHLYYTESWGLFFRKLNLLKSVTNFDLFITMPKENIGFQNTIRESFPNVIFFVVKNRGRDVLPFLKVGKLLKKTDYSTVLKFHSKKSTHRNDGKEWLENTLNQIIPNDKRTLMMIIQKINNPNTGVIGPAEFYYPLSINFLANYKSVLWILKKITRKKYDAHELAHKYGFFGGTMFWARIDSISPIFRFSNRNFQKEMGQTDGTFAHSVERVLCVFPELNNRKIYSCDGKTVRITKYISGNIPDWSTDHDKI
jgi:lipopolysaccharide biosynthesis protein